MGLRCPARRTHSIRFLNGRNDRVSSEQSSYRCGYSYSFDRLLAAHRHRSEPAVAVVLLAAHDGVELLLDRPGDGANRALATSILSTEWIGVTFAAVPVKNASSAM